MSSNTISLLAISISGLTLVVLIMVARALLRHSAVVKSGVQRDPFPSSIASYRPPDNPITRLTFRESFVVEEYVRASRDSALSQLNEALRSRAADGLVISLNGIRLLPSNIEMTVTVSEAGQAALENGIAVIGRHQQSGAFLPILKDAETGRIIEVMKEGPLAGALSNLALRLPSWSGLLT